MQRTLGIIKPDAMSQGLAGKILDMILQAGFHLRALEMVHLTPANAQRFYAVHKDRPFFDSLTRFMSSGPVLVFILEAEDVIARYRELMGATDPSEAKEGTLRARFGTSIERNAVHGSDSADTAAQEIAFFFEPSKAGD